MKILFECTSVTPGESCGVEAFLYSLISGLQNCGCDDELFINILPGTRYKYEAILDENRVIIYEDLWQKKIKEIYRINRLFRTMLCILNRIGFKNCVDKVFAIPRTQWKKMCERNIDVVLYPFHKGIIIQHESKPIILVMHDLRDLERNPDMLMPIYLEQIEACKAIVTSWPHPFQLLKQFFPEFAHKIYMIPFVTEPIPSDDDIQGPVVPRMLIYPSSNGIDKNHENLIIALGILKSKAVEPVKIICPGFQLQDRATKLDKLIKEYRVEDWISFIGFVPRSHIRWLYKVCSGVVTTTKYEAFSGAVLEGLSYGKPIACSRIPSLTLMIDSIDATVKYFDPDDPNEIASSLVEIIHNPLPYVQGSLIGRKFISKITQKDTALKYRAIFEWAISQ